MKALKFSNDRFESEIGVHFRAGKAVQISDLCVLYLEEQPDRVGNTPGGEKQFTIAGGTKLRVLNWHINPSSSNALSYEEICELFDNAEIEIIKVDLSLTVERMVTDPEFDRAVLSFGDPEFASVMFRVLDAKQGIIVAQAKSVPESFGSPRIKGFAKEVRNIDLEPEKYTNDESEGEKIVKIEKS